MSHTILTISLTANALFVLSLYNYHKENKALKKLLEINNMIVLGTDFPVEQVNPILTWYASVIRKNKDGIILEPFKENILEKYETMMGMTYYPAFAEYRENEKGKIRPGMWADFTLLDRDLFKTEEQDILKAKIS